MRALTSARAMCLPGNAFASGRFNHVGLVCERGTTLNSTLVFQAWGKPHNMLLKLRQEKLVEALCATRNEENE